MTPLEKQLAVIRGEALAAHVLASAAIQAALSLTANREEVLTAIERFIDETLNMSGPARGNPDDERNAQMRETARNQAMQTLDNITRMVRGQRGS